MCGARTLFWMKPQADEEEVALVEERMSQVRKVAARKGGAHAGVSVCNARACEQILGSTPASKSPVYTPLPPTPTPRRRMDKSRRH